MFYVSRCYLSDTARSKKASQQPGSENQWKQSEFIKALAERVQNNPGEIGQASNLAKRLVDFMQVNSEMDYWAATQIAAFYSAAIGVPGQSDEVKSDLTEMRAFLKSKHIEVKDPQ